jgi:hypothetical protein
LTDHPAIMSAPMVLALLAGRKTMTRRHAWRWKEPPKAHRSTRVSRTGGWVPTSWQRVKAGDRIWVRETWKPHSIYERVIPRDIPKSRIFYAADGGSFPSNTPWRSPIHMPRWASRLTLEVQATRIERLQEITEADCVAEGAPIIQLVGNPADDGPMVKLKDHIYGTPRTWFRELWDSLHGAGAWDTNPEVVVVAFKVVQP